MLLLLLIHASLLPYYNADFSLSQLLIAYSCFQVDSRTAVMCLPLVLILSSLLQLLYARYGSVFSGGSFPVRR